MGVKEDWDPAPGTDGISIIYAPVCKQLDNLTTVAIDFSILNLTQQITKYTVNAKRYEADGVTLISQDTPVREFTSKPLNITGLVPGGNYIFEIETYSGTQKGLSTTKVSSQLSTSAITAGMVGNVDPKGLDATPGKSYLTLSGKTSKTNAGLVYKTFDAIKPLSYDVTYNWAGLPSYVTDPQYTYGEGWYSFGTSVILDNTLTNTSQSAGMGFFVDNAGGTGYFIIIESTASAATLDRKSFRVVRVDGNQYMYDLNTSQTENEGAIDGIIGGKEYQIDVKVNVKEYYMTAVIKVNGYQITVIDSKKTATAAGSKGFTQILPPTSKLALVCFKGNAAFDYIYGKSITKEQFGNPAYDINFYQGQFSNDFLKPQFSDLIYTAETADNKDAIPQGTSFDEFGTTARQILKADVKFDSRPSYPINWSTGINKLAKVIAQKTTNFGATAYVLNNGSATIPLADGASNTFWIYGNTLGQSGDLEYITPEEGYNVKEPIVINTMWVQTLSDVKSIAKWIKSKVITKGSTIDMNCFGNPLIVPGDIVTVKYGYKGLLGTEKFIVTSVTHTYEDGLETKVSCRTF